MTSTRRLALAAGVFYLLTFALSIPAYFLYEPVLTDPAYILGPGGADTRIILGAVLEMLTALACIGTAVAVYPITRRQSEAAALGFVTLGYMRPRCYSWACLPCSRSWACVRVGSPLAPTAARWLPSIGRLFRSVTRRHGLALASSRRSTLYCSATSCTARGWCHA